jgi:hypothetical protein
MLKNVLTLAISIITLGSLSAQSFIGKLNPNPNTRASVLADDTVKILAVMVSFQEDRDGATFGNGKFGSIYSQNYGNDILDPLPHDRDYFESHLTFVKNYYQKVSNGKVDVQFTILPDTFSVTKTMRNYSPTPGSDDFTPMGQFAEEVWTKADEMYPGLPFSDYNLFVIFHAGVGRDISLPGSLGNERDLPSVYLGENSLKNIFGNTFDGFPVSNGAFKIKNSMIIPETESRELETITGKFLFEITINGLIAASVASYLGLPDLFDTNTGLSAIGRFGLMDGQAIFAYNGCFPPEPSAWEKIYLGWADEVEIAPGSYDLNLVTKLAAALADTVILKVPLNSSEYYLIENRQRDVLNDGATVTIKSNGNIITKNFPKDTTGFYSYDTDLLSGVVLDVDEFDWALPGNGIVVWHIDENVINEKLAENKINTDKTRRGVDVEEADGVQDIGEQFTTIFGDVIIGEGTEQDFWYADNKAELFKNIFNKDSRPNTKTNTGANSLITIKDFSSISNRMSFKIEYGDSIIKPLFESSGYTSSEGLSITSFESDNHLFAINVPELLTISNGDSTLETRADFSDFKPTTFRFANFSYIVGVKAQQFNSVVNIIAYDGVSFTHYNTNLNQIFTTPPVARDIAGQYQILIGTIDGKIMIYNFETLLIGNPFPAEIRINSSNKVTQISYTETINYAITTSSLDSTTINDLLYCNGPVLQFPDEKLIKIITTKNDQGKIIAVVSSSKLDQHYFHIVEDAKLVNTIKAQDLKSVTSFSIADLKNDGNNYIISNFNNKIYAINITGASADNFPFELKDGDEFLGLPLAADIEGDSKSEVIAFTKNGLVYAINGGTGKVVDGFPISFGSPLEHDAVLFYANDKIALAGIDQSNSFKGWSISSTLSRIDWAETFGKNDNASNIDHALTTESQNEFFPTSRAYNYPNPVYDGTTAIRYFVGEDSKINIKIFDLAGDYVAELYDDAQGGFDNETVWNVSNIQSGVYLARIEASGSSGKSESVIIKIAVVK